MSCHAITAIRGSARFNEDRTRRYFLERDWHEPGEIPRSLALFGLNPSKADEKDDDMTIRKGIGFCKRWGFNRLLMLNINPIVSTDPSELPMWNGTDIENTRWMESVIKTADLIVVAWGKPDKYVARNIAFGELVYTLRTLIEGHKRNTHCIGTTKDKSYPLHPSRTAYTSAPVEFDWEGR